MEELNIENVLLPDEIETLFSGGAQEQEETTGNPSPEKEEKKETTEEVDTENLFPESVGSEEKETKEKEGQRVLAKIKPGDYVISLDLNQKEYDSVSFSRHLEEAFVRGGSSLVFLIGGSLGLSKSLKARANDSFSFGPMTFPHQLARVMLLEQLYRAFRIQNGQPYHK